MSKVEDVFSLLGELADCHARSANAFLKLQALYRLEQKQNKPSDSRGASRDEWQADNERKTRDVQKAREAKTSGWLATKGEVRILTALAQAGRPLTLVQLAVRVGMKAKTGGMNKALARLGEQEYIARPAKGQFQITPLGFEYLGPYARLPEGAALIDYWKEKLGGAHADALGALRAAWVKSQAGLTRDELGDLIHLKPKTGGFNKVLAKLHKLDLIFYTGASVLLSDELRQAAEPMVSVFDPTSGVTHRLKAR